MLIEILYLFCNCGGFNKKPKYYVISKDSVNLWYDCIRRDDGNCLSKLKAVPLPPPGLDWYAGLVIIFDSTDRVYLYQTEIKENPEQDNNNGLFAEISKYPYPCFIGLKPAYLLSFSSYQFIEFIKSNNDILKLFEVNIKSNRFIRLAANRDTILNPAFYELQRLLNKPVAKGGYRTFYLTRLTTEEENNVIYCKKRNIEYCEKDFHWSDKFMNGRCKPFTKEYDSLEKKVDFIIKAKETLSPESTRLGRIL